MVMGRSAGQISESGRRSHSGQSSKNRVTGSGGVGIGIGGAGHLVTENRVSGSAQPDLADESAEGVNTYLSNRFGTVDFDYVF